VRVPKPKKQGFDYWMKVLRHEIKLHRSELDTPSQEEDAYFALQQYAAEHVDELIQAFSEETDLSRRFYLLELIGEARSPKALPVLVEYLRGDEERFWSWAIYGLRDLETREARKALWEAKSYTKKSEELTQLFQEVLERCSKRLVKVMQEDGTWSEWFEEEG
jgi:HEAT repeat protein